MENGLASGAEFVDDLERIPERVSDVHHERLLEFESNPDLVPERFDLSLSGRQVPIEVESDLPNGGGLLEEWDEAVALLRPLARVVRMQTCRE